MADGGAYFGATRHPWPCLLFLLPLLTAYEGGVIWLGGKQPEALRNGADAWLRWALEAFGLSQLYWAPAILAGALVIWAFSWRASRPQDMANVLSGMTLESVGFALGLWAISRGLGPFLDRLGIELATGRAVLSSPQWERTIGQVVTFVGAGIYEETLFRLGAFGGLLWVVRQAPFISKMAIPLAAALSAGLFAGAHHLGPYGEKFDGFVFLFRAVAGLYFALLFQFRGFGIAVGAHACYDVLVGVAIG